MHSALEAAEAAKIRRYYLCSDDQTDPEHDCKQDL